MLSTTADISISVQIITPAQYYASSALIATNSTDISWGEQIASTFGRPSHIYLAIFLVGLIIQSLFSVTLVTLSAAAALYGLNLVYLAHMAVWVMLFGTMLGSGFLSKPHPGSNPAFIVVG